MLTIQAVYTARTSLTIADDSYAHPLQSMLTLVADTD